MKTYLPAISFVVGVAALAFQTTVLYPWHNDLDRRFQELKQLKDVQDQHEREDNLKKLERIALLEQKINLLIKKHEQAHHYKQQQQQQKAGKNAAHNH